MKLRRGHRASPHLFERSKVEGNQKKPMKYAHVVASLCQTVWAIREETLMAMQNLIRERSEGARWSAEEIRDRVAEANSANGYVPIARDGARFLAENQELGLPAGRGGGILMEGPGGGRNSAAPGSVGLIPIIGVISQRASMISEISGPGGGASIQKLTAQFRQALDDPNCKAIVFDVDSPGGGVAGVTELASEIFNARNQKPIVAVVNSMSCSAAYWLSSAASRIVVSPGGQAGSIGVYMLQMDESEALKKAGLKINVIKAGKYKTEGIASEPLSDEARAAFQANVDEYYGMFVKAVAQNRGASQTAVRNGYGQGRSLLAAEAVKQNLADREGTLDEVLAGLGVRIGGKRRRERTDEVRMRNQLASMRAGAPVDSSGSKEMNLRRDQLASMRAGAPVDPSSSKEMNLRRDQLSSMRAGAPVSPARPAKTGAQSSE